MRTIRLKLGPLYSRLASDKDLKQLDTTRVHATTYKLRRHQAKTWEAFNNPNIDVIVNTALTGDGKSLAGLLPMLTEDRQPLLLYPTNELIMDQEKQIARYIEDFGHEYECQLMYSEKITEEIELYGEQRRSDVIDNWLKNRRCILSNPDFFHLLGSFNYGSPQDKREHTYQLPENFDYFVFDEFHIFGPPQVISVVNILNYHRIVMPHRKLKYVFLSATPSSLFRVLLENSGFNVHPVEGDYSPIPDTSTDEPKYTSNPIVRPVDLHVHSLSEKGAYAWAEEHLEELKDFYATNPSSKGVFIVNSVATAKRLVAFYKRELEEKGILKVGENTGLTHKQDKRSAMEDPDVQLIIATSTVDVGVDFKINLLIFESTGVGTFIQRLGRLGRHDGWQEYRAYALLPDWIAGRFTTHFTDGSEVERTQFLQALQKQKDGEPIFTPEQEYKHYAGCWGGLQAAHIIASVQNWKIGATGRNELSRDLRQQYNKVYRHKTEKDWIGKQVGRYCAMAKDEDRRPILTELNAFRGRSPLICGIFDEVDQHFKSYDLFFLLANTNFYPISEAKFKRMVEEKGENFEKYRSHDLKLYVCLKNYVEERETFNLTILDSFKNKLYQVLVCENFRVESRILTNHLNDSLNERLAELSLVCLVAKEKPQMFKRQLGLNQLFPVYQVKDEEKYYSIVFGLNALLAHSLSYWKGFTKDCDELLIF